MSGQPGDSQDTTFEEVSATALQEAPNLEQGLVAAGAYFDMVPIEIIQRVIAHVEAVKKAVLIPGKDYDIIEGTNEPTLLQPGAQKLRVAFHFTDIYTVVEHEEDFGRDWWYTRLNPIWEGDIIVSYEERKMRTIGWAKYRVKCTLFSRTGRKVCDAIGQACSSEAGLERLGGHSLLARAQKRALVRAICDATMSSGLFATDLDEMPELVELLKKRKAQKNAKRDSKRNEPATDKQIGLLKRLAKERQISDDLAIELQKFFDGENTGAPMLKYEASNFIDKLQKAPIKPKGQAASPPTSAPVEEESQSTNGLGSKVGPDHAEMVQDCVAMEQQLLQKRSDMGAKMKSWRMKQVGQMDLIKAPEAKIHAYARWLAVLTDKSAGGHGELPD